MAAVKSLDGHCMIIRTTCAHLTKTARLLGGNSEKVSWLLLLLYHFLITPDRIKAGHYTILGDTTCNRVVAYGLLIKKERLKNIVSPCDEQKETPLRSPYGHHVVCGHDTAMPILGSYGCHQHTLGHL